MRFLIVSAVLACAAAAPSHLEPVIVAQATLPLAYTAPIPTLSPGDLQAAAIDAQVKAQDIAIAAADEARKISDNVSENLTEKQVTESDLNKENNQEAFWSVKDKEWQALDALKTAEARLDGAIASNAPLLAKNTILTPFGAAVPAITPIVYTPGLVAPVNLVTPKEQPKAEKAEENDETMTKKAEEKKVEKDSVAIEAGNKNLEEKPQLGPFIPIAVHPYSYPIVAPVALSPVLKYSTFPQIGFAPTIVKTAW